MGFFYRHNIHPYSECLRREETVRTYCDERKIKVIFQEDYDLEGFLQRSVFREKDRCRACFHDRLKTTALLAKRGKFDLFSTTLLYSKYQDHELINTIGQSLALSTGVPFYYSDFREGWQEGIQESKELNMYRQQYCGCIYSEKERFFKSPEQSGDHKR
jgi:predicted adenine nucleotide alpha hydrolase (AANH) superfamily ATPase